ncbi:MAG: 6,7-dimethyl-8-ribityllumazine synthase [Elusimicrobiota bacterium]
MEIIKGNLNGTGKRAAVVMSRRNDQVVSKLLEGVVSELGRNGLSDDGITVYEVPGSWEIASCVEKLSESSYDMIICLGAVIRGETPHFEYVSSQAARTIAQQGIKKSIPVSFGLLTADTLEQALERSGGKGGNKGEEAARAALEMSDIYVRIK